MDEITQLIFEGYICQYCEEVIDNTVTNSFRKCENCEDFNDYEEYRNYNESVS